MAGTPAPTVLNVDGLRVMRLLLKTGTFGSVSVPIMHACCSTQELVDAMEKRLSRG